MEDFTPADAGAVATAVDDARAEAEKRREKMPTSAAAFDHRAEGLLGVLKKILDRLPERFHEHRALVYRDYRSEGSQLKPPTAQAADSRVEI
jgi:hypothetical protein